MTLQTIARQLYQQLDVNARYEHRDLLNIQKALKQAQQLPVQKKKKRKKSY